MAESNGSSGENQNSRRLDEMQAVIQSMIHLVHEQMKASTQQTQEVLHVVRESHLMFMEEVRELITLQKEQRIDIAALFQAQKNVKERLDKIEGGNG